MRDPARIPILLEALRVAWEKNPDLRLTQLLVNTLDARPNAIFYVEDDITLARLKGEDVPVPLMQPNPHDAYVAAHRTLDTISKWWAFRESDKANYEGRITDPRHFDIEADHSLRGGLLGRMLLEGKDPLPLPPPTYMSRPWYSLVEKGEGITYDLFPLSLFDVASKYPDVGPEREAAMENHVPAAGETIVVGQAAEWTFVEAHPPEDGHPVWSIRHPGVGVCRATRHVDTTPFGHPFTRASRVEMYWKLKVTEPVAAPLKEQEQE
jgi:uncharacterized protein YihD (DUF1040 family)